MAIEIVKAGIAPDRQFTAVCRSCDSHLRFLRSDGRVTYDLRDGDYISIDCPVCNHEININLL